MKIQSSASALIWNKKVERGQLAGIPNGKASWYYGCNCLRELEGEILFDLDSLLFGH